MTMGRRMAAAVVLLSMANIAVRALSLFTLPILTRVLPPEAYGTAAIAGSLAALLGAVALAGIDMSYARAYHVQHGPGGLKVERFAWRYTIVAAVAAGILGTIGWEIARHWIALPSELGPLVGVTVVLSLVNVMVLVRARLNGRYRQLAWATVASGVLTIVTTIALSLWWQPSGAVIVIGILVGQTLVTFILGVPHVRVLLTPSGLTGHERWSVMNIGLAGVVTAPMYWIMTSLDRWFLGAAQGAAVVGVYAIAFNIGAIGALVNNSLSAVWLPEAAKFYETDRAAAPRRLGVFAEKIVLATGVVWLAITAAGGDILRLLTSEPYHAGAIAIPFVAGAVFFRGVFQTANAAALLTSRLYLTGVWTVIAAALCVGLNLILIPYLGLLGAAIAQTLSAGVAALSIWGHNREVLVLPKGPARLATVLLLLIVAGIAMFPAWSTSPSYSLLAKAPVGLTVAAVLSWHILPEAIKLITARAGRMLGMKR
jgi:antigen flippase